MAYVNVNASADQAPTMAPPTRTDDQILRHIRWHTNFFRAFTASSTIPSIYIHQFRDTVRYDKTARCYKCQLDEQWFDLPKDTLKDALQITPVNNNNAFSSPSSSDALINFVNDLGYPKVVRNLSNVVTNDMFQPWRALTTIINLCLTGKTFEFERPRAPRKHKFHLRPNSLLHSPNEEPVLGYLKFSAKGSKREVFGMPVPGNLITADIQGEPYYQDYLKKVAKHQRYLVGETGSDPDSPALKPTKATKKSKPSTPKVDLRPPVTKPASYQQPKPKPAPAKSKGKKRKLVTKTSDKPSLAKRSKPSLVTKRRKPTSSLRSRALEESLKSIYDAPRGPLPPVVIRVLESRKYQPLLEVQGKGKEKVTDEHVALDLLTLQTPKKKSPADQFIFQRRTSTPTGSFGHDESSSLYAKLRLTDSEVESDEDVPGIDVGVQDSEVESDEDVPGIDVGVQGEGQAGPNPGEQDEGQVRPNPGEQDEGQARPNPGDAAASQPQSSPVVHAGPNLKHMYLEATDVSTQPHPKQMDEGFTVTAYPKTTAKTKAESMVFVTIQQDTSAIPPMITLIIDLTSRPDSLNVHRPLQETATETIITTTTIHPPPPQPQQSSIDFMLMKRIDKLEHIMANLIQDNKHLEERDLPEADMKKILHQRMWETNSYKTHEDHVILYEALEKSMNRDHTEELLKDLAKVRKKKKKSRDSPNMPPGSPPHQPPSPSPPAGLSGTSGSPGASGSSQVLPPPPTPPSTNQEGQSHGFTTPSSLKTAASAEYKAWTTTDTRLRLSISSTPEDLQMDDDMAPDAQAHSSNDEDIKNAHIPKVNLRQD
nr:E-beta-farnesene synthase [Tanacetum cinerariifolium]